MIKTETSQKMYERACRSLATGVSTGFRRRVTPVPMYFERGKGPYYYDVDGQEFLDYGLAFGPLIVGNNHAKLTEAVTRQMSRAYTFGAQHQGEIDLAELMVKVLPGVDRVIFANTGSEAVQSALRLARAKTGRDMVVKFEGHYHGWHNNMLVSNHPTQEQLGRTSPACGGQPPQEYALTIAVPWNDLDALRLAFADHPDRIAAVITEPILVNGGSCMPGDGYLKGVIDLCVEHGTVSIFDEVITGFRIALGGAREWFGLVPDLSIYAKAMAGGFSMAAVAGRRGIFDVLDDGRTGHFGTYNGNPISVVAAIATIQILSEPGTFERMNTHGDVIRRQIEQAGARCGCTLATSGTGTAFSVHFGLTEAPRSWTDVMKADAKMNERFRARLLEKNIYLLPDGRWYVGATHTDRELEKVIPAIDQSMKEIA